MAGFFGTSRSRSVKWRWMIRLFCATCTGISDIFWIEPSSILTGITATRP